MKIFNSIKNLVPMSNKKGTVVRIDIYIKTDNEIEDFQYGLRAFHYSMQKRGKQVRVFVNYLKESSTEKVELR